MLTRKLLRLASALLAVVLFERLASADEPAKSPPVAADHAAKMKAGLELFHGGVRQSLVGRCVKCHGGEKTEGKFDLATREAFLKGGDSGPAVKLGDSANSFMLKLIRHEEEPNMPEDGAKLPETQINAIAKWIDLGAPYDKPLVDQNVRPDAWTEKRVEASSRQFWSFQPLAKVTPPVVTDEKKWGTTPIDQFVLEKLAAKKISPNAVADRRRLIRRLYFDLIGLPPSADEVERFVADPDPNAYAKLVDRLLDNSHFGERWARHWLDVARFAESHGFEQDYDRPHAYHYRDFVIRALNDDMPFDQFVRWQLAGDEIEPQNPQAWMATGFLGAGVFPTQLTEKEFESARYDELDDMISTTGTAMLGLTLGCARCHDHKYDPIPSADYYRLINSFATAIRSNVEFQLDSEADRQAIASWEAAHKPLAEALAKFEREQLPRRFENWLKQQADDAKNGTSPAAAAMPTWFVLDFSEMKSKGGATLAPQPDGSVLLSGKNPPQDTLTLVTTTLLTGVTALKLEAMADKSFPKSGPGRAANGNFALSKIRIQAEPLAGEKRKPVEVKLVRPRATFEQNKGSLSIASSLDDDPKSGWAVDPKFGQNHAAIFDFETPLALEGGAKLTITLDFNVNTSHVIGRPRLSLTTATAATFDGETQSRKSAEILALVKKSAGNVEALSAKEVETLSQWYRTTDPEWRKLNDSVAKHLASQPKPRTTQVMVVSENVKPIPHHADGRGFPHFYKETFFLKRGSAEQKQGPATQSFLQVLMRNQGTTNSAASDPLAAAKQWQIAPPENAKSSFRRLSLANWIIDTEEGAGHLLARVIVNRLWQHHLGRGIVSTPNDFGYQGQRPSHPELLDWLASQLIANGWKLKPIHRLILQSSVYRQDSLVHETASRIDPDNQFFWRYEPQRLQAEIIRDSMLAASGSLDETMFGPGTLDESHKRRSIYFMIKRSRLIPMMQLFDSPEPLVSVGGRPSTTIAPQALMFMNNSNVRGYARAFAKKLANELPASISAEQRVEQLIQRGYLSAIGRAPTRAEHQDAATFLAQQTTAYESAKQSPAAELALTDLCQVFFCLNEFVYVE